MDIYCIHEHWGYVVAIIPNQHKYTIGFEDNIDNLKAIRIG